MPFTTKICGITNPEDARLAMSSGVDAIGLNFFPKSKRYVDNKTASEIVKQLKRNVKRVGVFVNASRDAILKTVSEVNLDFVQLHGDESPEFIVELNDAFHIRTSDPDDAKPKVIRAFRCRDGLVPVADYLGKCEQLPVAVLVDAYDPNEYGGTGKTLHWPDLASAQQIIGDIPLILAGGLTPANVATAIEQARPFGVDTASGVEGDDPRRKDRDLMADFVANAEKALASLR